MESDVVVLCFEDEQEEGCIPEDGRWMEYDSRGPRKHELQC